jgi:hypothetical protein
MSRLGRFTPGKETLYPLYRRLGGPQDMSRGLRKISPTLGFDRRTVASCNTDSAVPAHFHCVYYMYYMRKCKSFMLAVCMGSVLS